MLTIGVRTLKELGIATISHSNGVRSIFDIYDVLNNVNDVLNVKIEVIKYRREISGLRRKFDDG